MMTLSLGLKALVLFLAISVVMPEIFPEIPLLKSQTTTSVKKLVNANNDFAFNLYQQMTREEPKNIFFSPLSISAVLSMLLHGAKGETRKELRSVLGYEKEDLSDELVQSVYQSVMSHAYTKNMSSGYILNSASSILVEKSLQLLPKYKDEVERSYNTSIQSVDFETEAPEIMKEINNWVEEQTNGKIKDFLNDVDTSSKMVLLNAMYFKGLWEVPFNPKDTSKMPFYGHGENTKPKNVSMMKGHDEGTHNYSFSSKDDYEALMIPYQSGKIDMLIIVPKESNGLPALVKSLTREKINNILLDFTEIEVVVYLPKFKFEFSADLSEHLIALGLQSLSDGALDLSGMTKTGKVPLNQALHKAVIEVTEEGTEAAAATAYFHALSLPQEFIVNKPFVFIIIDRKSRLILFMGQVAKL